MSLFLQVQLEKEKLKQEQRLKESSLEQELLKKLDKRKSSLPNTDIYTVKKDTYTSKFLDTDRQSDILDRMLENYRLYKLKDSVRDFIKSISRYEPDYHTYQLTSRFIDSVITMYKETHQIKIEENKK
jgi:hypothetical protein